MSSAPALVMLAHGSDHPAEEEVARDLSRRLQTLRPGLSINLAFLDPGTPSGEDEVNRLVAEGFVEIVFIPLDLARAVEPDDAATALLARVREQHPTIKITSSRPIGPATSLLSVVDERLRAALRATHTVELDGLVLSLPQAGDARGNALVARRARQWSNHHKLPVVVSVADGSGPSPASAIAALRAQGRRHIAVGSLFIGETSAFSLQAEQSRTAGAVAVSAPLGADDRVLELVMARYSYAAMEMLDDEALGAGGDLDTLVGEEPSDPPSDEPVIVHGD
ncbi:sirohydrochlorin chelatase [Propionibacteriaceae bacterium Y1923]|uniref:sirohydrochlorin chelatase n=1 Tax=Aestuariimicrobium sp. Y1814 TaxID=3418742 RepID=UPI003C26C959